MPIIRPLRAAAALAVLLAAAPAHAGSTGLRLNRPITPEELGGCYATVDLFLKFAEQHDFPVEPVWRRMDTFLGELGNAYGPEDEARASAAVRQRADGYSAIFQARGAQALSDAFGPDLTACAALVTDLE